MKKDVYISIKGSQECDGETDSIELTTAGNLFNKNGKYYLTYSEGTLEGMEECSTTLKIAPDGIVTMMRSGTVNTHLVFEEGRCHIGYYETQYGDFTISVTANHVNADIGPDGGSIDIDYIMDVNNSSCSHNGISLTVRA